jgi:hypothetical protein
MEIQMSNKVNAKWTTLTIVRIIAIILLVISLIVMIWSLDLFKFAGHLFSTQQKVAENQPHGVDAVGGLVGGLIGFIYFWVAFLVFVISTLTIIFTSLSLRKKNPVSASQPADGLAATPQTPTSTIAANPEVTTKTSITSENK